MRDIACKHTFKPWENKLDIRKAVGPHESSDTSLRACGREARCRSVLKIKAVYGIFNYDFPNFHMFLFLTSDSLPF